MGKSSGEVFGMREIQTFTHSGPPVVLELLSLVEERDEIRRLREFLRFCVLLRWKIHSILDTMVH